MERHIRQPIAVRNDCGSDCGCCSCINLRFLTSTPGMLKLAQLIFGSMCQSLLITYGSAQASVLGTSFNSLLLANAAAVATSTLLLATYILSKKSFVLVRSSFFETLFNVWATMSYFSGSTYLSTAVYFYLYPVYLVTIGFLAYPAMIGAYVLGFVLGVLHGIDAYQCYRFFKGYR